MSTFPSVLTSYTDPTPTNRLNSPSHSSIESAQNSGISQLEAVIGVSGASSVVGTYEYLIKSPASNGGGHVQTANKGGTGQTSFNKGDVLIAQSSSVISKLSVGTDADVLTADSASNTGIKWASVSSVVAGLLATYQPLLVSKSGTTTREHDTGSGTITIAHGLGVIPRYTRFTGSAALNYSHWFSVGTYNGTTNYCAHSFANGADEKNGTSNAYAIGFIDSIGRGQLGVVTFDATNIYIAWTVNGDMDAGTMQIVWEAQS